MSVYGPLKGTVRVFSLFSLCISGLSRSFLGPVQHLFGTCSGLDQDLFGTFFWIVRECFGCASWHFETCSKLFRDLFGTCSIQFQYFFNKFSGLVPDFFGTCLWFFWNCFRSGSGLFRDCFNIFSSPLCVRFYFFLSVLRSFLSSPWSSLSSPDSWFHGPL